ncbi:MAG: pyridoxal-dependent decarboxylase, exosortase A system-associated, partial [Alphaproteobacteria bacterium]|nr:pyridoxal-dependent decarboxylase, exosortase A system-associated [Alphaproteobacteria bacterium]MBU1462960.1 pyridoxal-dependent decarboxylase, exosortase A system-associated [Alphaproteobacteria bacterium]
MGPIPAWFAGEEGMLLIGGYGAASLVDEVGDTPLFAYDMDIVRAQIRRFREAMPQALHLHYAIKANPYAPLLTAMAEQVDGFDIASGGELEMALAAGMDPAWISFAGPGKRNDELEAAIFAGVTLNLESEGEGRRALAIGQRIGKTPRVAVRVN